ncbi:radical SAM protein [Vibrio cholerae]|uniref:Radical SAM protein n=1 Tax=Vibrio cholerae TaxID=666 RepID=A0A5Q6PJ46_VIBCL|nr:SPASM domain-containing protein [Vibrio cholerae]KAA1254700.1 radical SAM protein [Vibrio cholerae]
MNNQSFVLHFRITKNCNANCSYCSSAMQTKLNSMTPNEAKISAENTLKYWDDLGIKPKYLTIEYVGGEVTMLPIEDLKAIVLNVREVFVSKGINVTDGVQSNLLASKRKLDEVYKLFDGRIGTSIDNFTKQRKLGTSSARYRKMLTSSLQHVKSFDNKTLPAVLTIDGVNKGFILDEYHLAEKESRNIVVRPVFQGGSDIVLVSESELEKIYLDLFEAWFMKGNILLEPFNTLLKKRLEHFGLKGTVGNFCSWQSDCVDNSLSIEPNGDIYVCQELADHDFGKLGNIIDYSIDRQEQRKLLRRKLKIAKECGGCPYFKECQGGCMMHAIEKRLSVYDKTPYCTTWKSLFALMDKLISQYKLEEIESWILNNEQ